MILWTLQPFSWWTILKENGKITADLAKIESDPNAFYEDRYNYAYGWLVEEMKQRLPVPRPYPSAYPIWAWYQWDGVKRKAPDLRTVRHCEDVQQNVRIKFEIDDKLVLLSDYVSWHYILYDVLITRPDEESDEDDEDLDSELPSYTEEEKRKSWNQIFELDFSCPLEEAIIQATFWELKLEQVKEVKEFGKNKRL